MKPIVRKFPSAKYMAGFLVQLIRESIDRIPPGRFVSIALAGGSTPRFIFRGLAEIRDPGFDWNRVLFFWGDERAVGPDHPDSNYLMARENLLDKLGIPSSNIFRIMGEADPVGEAERYSALVSGMLDRQNGAPRFDLFLLGLGEDGHTVSVFPGGQEIFDSEKLFECTRHPVTGQARITATGRLINNAKRVIFIVTGENKAARIAQIIGRGKGYENLPASWVNPAEGEVTWVLDGGAAKELRPWTME
jgi:6-phosphogluconolactonase